MDRRLFIKKSCGGLLLLEYPEILTSANKTRVSFGLITDLHFANRQNAGSRYYSESKTKLLEALEHFNKKNVDFLIELGDFKDQGNPPEKQETLTYLDEIETTLQSFDGAVYHVLGNHDMDSISKDDFLSHTYNSGRAKGKNFYSFFRKGIKFIILDANYKEDGTAYDSGNFDWTYSKVPEKQLLWLQEELSKDNSPSIVFIHQLLDSFSGVSELVCVRNANDVTAILEKSNKVLAVFQGHHHEGNYSFRNGIHYFTMKAMVEGALPVNNSYAIVEIDNELDINIKGFNNCKDMVLKREREFSQS
jgi:3',5'-cyclic AMP phosphodiesterase CpdA